MMETDDVSIREDFRDVMREGPNSSAPTAPSMRTVRSEDALALARERRAVATAL